MPSVYTALGDMQRNVQADGSSRLIGRGKKPPGMQPSVMNALEENKCQARCDVPMTSASNWGREAIQEVGTMGPVHRDGCKADLCQVFPQPFMCSVPPRSTQSLFIESFADIHVS